MALDPGTRMHSGVEITAAIDERITFDSFYGELTIASNSTGTVLTTKNTVYPITAGWAAGDSQGVTVDATKGQITAPVATGFLTLGVVAFTSDADPQLVEFGIYNNGTLIPSHKATTWTDTKVFPNTVPITGIVKLAVGDVLDIRCKCTTADTVTVIVTDANFSVTSL